jgi:cytochrome c oxidase cbb3-type subunit 3
MRAIWISSVVLTVGAIVAAQEPGVQPGARPANQAKTAPRDPAQSPASQPGPRTVTPQTYPSEQIQAGALRFTSQCGFCHGRDAAGGETGPDLTRSELVAQDTRGDKIGPLLRAGRADKGMPSFSLSATDVGAIVAFIHDQKTKSETLGGGRRSVDDADLATGDAAAGRSYFNGAGGCAGCHSATGDLAGIATRYRGLALLQRMLYPSRGRPAPKVTFTLASGQAVIAPLAGEDEFTITVLDPLGARQTYEKSAVKFQIDDPLSAHFDRLGKYTDADMHNVYAYLETLK